MKRKLLVLLLAWLIQPLIALGTPPRVTITEGAPPTGVSAPSVALKPLKRLKVAEIKKVSPVFVAAKVTTPKPPVVVKPMGSKSSLIASAGIKASDYFYVDYIVTHESQWDPNATNSSSGAHGLPQALPYSKTGCGWTDSVCQLQWANTYAVSRYGSWAAAYSYWVANGNW